MPHFRGRVIWGTCLRFEHALSYFRDIKVSELKNPVFRQEKVGTLDVAVNNFELMKGLESLE